MNVTWRLQTPPSAAVNGRVAANPDLPLLDAIEPNELRYNRWRCDHGWDIDLDDGSTNYHIYNNLCLNGGIKNREGFGRVVENNIMVNNTYHPHVWYAQGGDVFRKNIIFSEYRPAGMHGTWGTEMNSNLLHQPGATVQPATRLQQQSGRDVLSQSGDALFMDAADGDYRVKDGSPALSLGFVNFPMDEFGVQSPDLKRIAKTPLPATTDAQAKTEVEPVQHWLGADLKMVTTPGEVSATGLANAEGVLILRVPLDSAAAKAGLQESDVILKLNSKPVNDWKEFVAAWKAAGDAQVSLELWREQKALTIQLKAAH